LVTAGETKKWIDDIKTKGLETFTFSDLKDLNLAQKKYLEKAASLDLIRKAGKVHLNDANKTPVVKWKIQKSVSRNKTCATSLVSR
jgi:hypothetical protein